MEGGEVTSLCPATVSLTPTAGICNRLQPLWQSPRTPCLTASGAVPCIFYLVSVFIRIAKGACGTVTEERFGLPVIALPGKGQHPTSVSLSAGAGGGGGVVLRRRGAKVQKHGVTAFGQAGVTAPHVPRNTCCSNATPTPHNMTIQSNRPADTPEHKSTCSYTGTNTLPPTWALPAACTQLYTTFSIGLEPQNRWFQKDLKVLKHGVASLDKPVSGRGGGGGATTGRAGPTGDRVARHA